MFRKIKDFIIETIKEEYKFILFLILIIVLFNYPMDYYITMGGGISDVSTRIEVENKNPSKGSFNISYVTQLDANPIFYGLSYIIPTWEREDASKYKYNDEENLEDIQFRSDLYLAQASSNATYWAYKLADKEVKLISSKLYVTATFPEEYKTDLKVGDELLAIDEKSCETVEEYVEYLQTKAVGDKVNVLVSRRKKEKKIPCEIYDIKGQKVLGIGLQVLKKYETDPKVDIKFKSNESGSSGGLITTLEIYNQLTKKDITKGHTIAGTGTIEEDGTIGQIGGIRYKILGASSAKADYFLSPGGENYQEAKEYIKEKNLKIKLIKIDTIQDAIEKLEGLD